MQWLDGEKEGVMHVSISGMRISYPDPQKKPKKEAVFIKGAAWRVGKERNVQLDDKRYYRLTTDVHLIREDDVRGG
jgi:hypothetical protein